jgi:hypothetical protein
MENKSGRSNGSRSLFTPLMSDLIHEKPQKKPVSKKKDRRFFLRQTFTAFHRRLIVKRTRAGFLTLPTSTRLPVLRPFNLGTQGSGFFVKALPSSNHEGEITAAWPSPTLTEFPFPDHAIRIRIILSPFLYHSPWVPSTSVN